jgi:hypothetical protein
VHEITDTSYVRLRFIKVVSKVTVMRWGRTELTYRIGVLGFFLLPPAYIKAMGPTDMALWIS